MTRILFVDDEPQVLEGLKSSLYTRRKDWNMHFAQGGANAIALMRETHFDVLVTDLRMPEVDGTTLLARTRTESPDTICIVLSGYSDEEQSQRLISLAHRYLSKPCEPTRLEECVNRCLAIRALIQSEDLRAQLGSLGALSPMPATFAALQRVLADPKTDARKVATIVQKDPAIAARVLQACNSAFFRLPRRVANIQQAVSYLGLSTVRSLVLSAELFKPGKPLCAALDLGQLQRHALSVALMARSLAAETVWAEDAFLAGLLHDIGFLILGRQCKVEMQQALEAHTAGMPLEDAERKFVGVDHGTAGAYLLGLWALPYDVVETVANHMVPERIDRIEFDVLGAVVMAHALVLSVRPHDVPVFDARTSPVAKSYLRTLGYPDSWESMIDRASSLLETEWIV